jgi:hypothetical protein
VRRGLPRLERHGAAAVAVVTIVISGAAGCGGGGSNSGTDSAVATTSNDITRTIKTITNGTAGSPADDQSLIRSAITAVYASGDPTTACETYATAAYVIAAFGDIDGCKAAQTAGGHAKGVTMTRIVVDGDKATALAVPIGGPSANEVIDLTLVKVGGVWKVDSGTSKIPVGP